MKYDINQHAQFVNATKINYWELILLVISCGFSCLSYEFDLEVFGGFNFLIFSCELSYIFCSFINTLVLGIICKKKKIDIKDLLKSNKVD